LKGVSSLLNRASDLLFHSTLLPLIVQVIVDKNGIYPQIENTLWKNKSFVHLIKKEKKPRDLKLSG